MITDKKTASAVGGRTARACDSCLRKRARWFCAADDAFLCQSCDASVHSANLLASRHERVRLETASSKTSDPPAWHHGFTRKARTPRNGKPTWTSHHKEEKASNPNPVMGPLVPEIEAEDASFDENEEDQLLYRVPIYDPFVAELCDVSNQGMIENGMGSEARVTVIDSGFVGTVDLDMDLTDFDVESLLGKGLDDEECFGIKELGLLECKEEEVMDVCFGSGRVKVEDDEGRADADVMMCYTDGALDATRETLDWNFDYDSPVAGEEEEEEKVVVEADTMDGCKTEVRRRISLRLDYDSVITAWAGQGSPWTMGTRPELNPDDSWPDFMGSWTTDYQQQYSETAGSGGTMGGGGGDVGREARVSRYREKRRTRLFSKKIRYEVRKLNAEKRPRMKGRFVKRTPSSSFQGSGFPYLN